MLSANAFNRCVWLLIVGLVSACGSGGDSTSPISTQETEPVEPEISGIGESVSQDENLNSSEELAELTDPLNDDEPANTDSQQDPQNPEAEDSDNSPGVTGQSIADNQGLNFGASKMLVDLTPNGDSNPAKFHRIGDELYFWTVDTDPRFARCSSHWNNLSDADKNISFNFVAAHAESGVVSMNKKIMTLGDFAEDPNNACAGYNGSIMHVYEHIWYTSESAAVEQQFALHFDHSFLGPNSIWTTDGTEANTRQLETGKMFERSIFVGDKVFFVYDGVLSVSNSLSGDRRKLFEPAGNNGRIRQILRSPARQAAFEITVGSNRSQIWTYDLDTDEWAKTFSLKPDDNIYLHHETLLVDGPAMLSLGRDIIANESVLGLSSTFGDVTSIETLSSSAPSIRGNYNYNADNSTELFYTTADYLAEPRITSIWRYSQERIENLFSISEPDLLDIRVIPGLDNRIYVAGTKKLQQGTDSDISLQLWSYDQQTEQLVKLSKDDWYAFIPDHPTYDEGYTFRFLTTPEGLIFINLTKDSGRELWFTDGTPEGTRQLADINPGIGNSDPQDFYYSGDAIYFSANDGTHGREPWMIAVSR